VAVGGRVVYGWEGEVEFEPWGVSGAAVYNCSRWVARHGPGDFELRLETPEGVLKLRNPEPRPLKEAIVTVGGVALEEVDLRTMRARKVPGVYFAGEVLDIDGPTGGYNLSLAFATAALAVEDVARRRG
jgi:predicted flavoprotein YhiN